MCHTLWVDDLPGKRYVVGMKNFTEATMKAHRATWWVYVGEGSDRKRIRRQQSMRGFWTYDVTCSCGEFDTNTGGGTRTHCEDELWAHRFSEETAAMVAAGEDIS